MYLPKWHLNMMHPNVNWSGGGRTLRSVLFHHVWRLYTETVKGAGPSAGRGTH